MSDINQLIHLGAIMKKLVTMGERELSAVRAYIDSQYAEYLREGAADPDRPWLRAPYDRQFCRDEFEEDSAALVKPIAEEGLAIALRDSVRMSERLAAEAKGELGA